MTTHRRSVLAALGATFISAGCLETAAPGSRTRETPTDTHSGDQADTPSGSADQTIESRKLPGEITSEPCPSFTTADRAVCWHTKPADADLYLEPSTERFQPVEGNDTVETITFTLVNDSDDTYQLNPYAWALKEKTGQTWTHVAPDEYIEPLETIAPGETYKWVLGRRSHPSPNKEQTFYPTVAIDDGRYAFSIRGWLGGDTDDHDQAEHIECIALFDVAVQYHGPGTTPPGND